MAYITDVELTEAVKQNDIAKICELLDAIGAVRGGGSIRYDPYIRKLLQIILTDASAMASINKLSNELSEELVARVAPCCELFPLLRSIAIAAEIESVNYDAVPKDILDYIINGAYLNIDAIQRIENLDADGIKALIGWALSHESPSSIFMAFNAPILTCIHKRTVITATNLLAFMAGTLREPYIDPLSALAELFS